MLGSMLDNAENGSDSLQRPVADDLLSDLLTGRHDSTDASSDRRESRMRLECAVTIVPASSSQRDTSIIEGHLRDASGGGVGTLTSKPPAVGDVYLLSFEDSPFECSQVFARCMHCRLIQEDTFESGFAFFAPAAVREGRV